jgi:hypothetical protein
MSSREVADLLLYEGGVAALAGTAFGAYGEGYIRLSYANSIENIEKALERIKTTLAAHSRNGKAGKTSRAAKPSKVAASATKATRSTGSSRAKKPAVVG